MSSVHMRSETGRNNLVSTVQSQTSSTKAFPFISVNFNSFEFYVLSFKFKMHPNTILYPVFCFSSNSGTKLELKSILNTILNGAQLPFNFHVLKLNVQKTYPQMFWSCSVYGDSNFDSRTDQTLTVISVSLCLSLFDFFFISLFLSCSLHEYLVLFTQTRQSLISKNALHSISSAGKGTAWVKTNKNTTKPLCRYHRHR